MSNKLLEAAKKAPHRLLKDKEIVPVTKLECEMFVAMVNGEITVRQYSMALWGKQLPGSVTHRSLTVVREGVERGWLKLNFIKS